MLCKTYTYKLGLNLVHINLLNQLKGIYILIRTNEDILFVLNNLEFQTF